MVDMRIAVVGDSAMWGQGLVEANKYWFLAASMIRQRLGSNWIFVDNIVKPRSGAKITATMDDRIDFIDTYPEVFGSEQEMANFLKPDPEGSEEPAARLFGDIPSTFPTVTYQVRSISEQQGERVNLLFLNGGANDLNFETFLNPDDHKNNFRKTYDPLFKKIFYDKVKDLVWAARHKCPNALVLITGYFTPFNPGPGSDFDGVKKLLIFERDADSFLLALNWVVNKFGAGVDIPSMMRKLKRRAQYGSTLGLYWMRKAIAELNEDPTVRGPGLIFVPSGIRPDNAVFRGKSFFHEQYEADKVEDRLKDQRARSYPRVAQIPTMKKLRNLIAILRHADQRQSKIDPKIIKDVRGKIKELLTLLKGPRQLIDSFNKALGAETDKGFLLDLRETWGALDTELNRFNHVQIASFLHPNEAGAQHYADNILARFDRHHTTTVKEDFIKLATSLNKGKKPSVVSVKDCLQRYGFDPRVGLRACIQHMLVDSLAVRITTRPDSEDFRATVELSIDPARTDGFVLTDLDEVERIFKPGNTDLIPLDTFGELHLSMIKQLRLQIKSVGNPTWKPSNFSLMINGKEVFSTPIFTTLSPNVPEILPYPG